LGPPGNERPSTSTMRNRSCTRATGNAILPEHDGAMLKCRRGRILGGPQFCSGRALFDQEEVRRVGRNVLDRAPRTERLVLRSVSAYFRREMRRKRTQLSCVDDHNARRSPSWDPSEFGFLAWGIGLQGLEALTVRGTRSWRPGRRWRRLRPAANSPPSQHHRFKLRGYRICR